MWSRHRPLAWLGLMINLAACGGAKLGSDGGAFAPAPWPPPDICGLLTFADVQPLLPQVDSTSRPDPLTPAGGPYWIDGCDWGSQAAPGGVLQLSLTGALTPDGETALDRDVTYTDVDASVQTVSGVGTAAAYIDVPGRTQSLTVRFKTYLITLRARSFTADVPETALQPLAVKVMGEL